MTNELEFLNQSALRAIQNRNDSKAIQLLLGICTGITADKSINDHEIAYLQTWISEHSHLQDQWPVSAIHYKIKEILADGIITDEERTVLLSRLQELTGNYFAETGATAPEAPTLPIDDDPTFFFKNMSYCFTGEFLFGTRAACERAILKLGAMPQDGITKKLNYLVIGSRCNPDWMNETYGRKIEKAMNYISEGVDIVIVSEKQWTSAMLDTNR